MVSGDNAAEDSLLVRKEINVLGLPPIESGCP